MDGFAREISPGDQAFPSPLRGEGKKGEKFPSFVDFPRE
jgi:hypothetical protein